MWDIVFLGDGADYSCAVYAPIQIYELSASKLHRRGIFPFGKGEKIT